jgi:predicted dehydrogenase
MSKYKILIVGGGSIGERHLRCFLATGRADVAVCDKAPDVVARLRELYRVEVFGSLEEARDRFPSSGLVICTPAHLHVAMARTALEWGQHVLIEKPVSVGLEGTDDLGRLAQAKGRVVAIAYVTRLQPVLQQARDYLASGDLGEALQVNVVSGQNFPMFRPAYRAIYYARHDQGGGAIQDALTHSVNAIEWLIGPTDSLFCDAGHQALEGVEVEDTVHVVARSGKTMVNYSLNQFQAPNEATFWIHCQRGSIRVEFHRQRWGVFRYGSQAWDWHDAPLPNRDASFIAQAGAFLDAMEGRETPLCSLEDGIQTLKFNLAALASAKMGQRVMI